jgi:hypothetical protein
MLCFDCEEGFIFFFEEGRYHKDICPMCEGTGTICFDREPIVINPPVSEIREKQDSDLEDYNWETSNDFF